MNQAASIAALDQIPAFCEGIQYFADTLPEMNRLGDAPVLSASTAAIGNASDEKAVYQTLSPPMRCAISRYKSPQRNPPAIPAGLLPVPKPMRPW